MDSGLRFASLIATALLSTGALAGRSLDLIVSVVPASGICGATVQQSSISVACGLATGVPVVVPPVASATSQRPTLATGAFGPAVAPFVSSVATGGTGLSTAPAAGGSAPSGPFDSGPSAPADLPTDGLLRSPEDEPGYRQIGVLPAASGRSTVALYSGGVNISSWRMVSTDNVQHVELTISW